MNDNLKYNVSKKNTLYKKSHAAVVMVIFKQ